LKNKSQQFKTKDEQFMLRLYEESLKQENFEDPLDKYYIGNLAGLQKRGVDAICHLLVQTNFIRKESQTEISITPHGAKLVERFLDL
jgi:hypothetical protein